LEIAGGGGSIAEWLCRQVGGSGHVVATDLDPRFLKAINASNLEVWRHDILREPLPMEAFDLVHARAVLVFLPQPVETISKMVAALKPGGWLLDRARDGWRSAARPRTHDHVGRATVVCSLYVRQSTMAWVTGNLESSGGN
jgi:SAM-dependent methyltransferase